MSNPFLNENTLKSAEVGAWSESGTMTVNGTIHRAGFLVLLVIGAAAYSWNVMQQTFAQTGTMNVNGLFVIGGIGGLVLALITASRPTIARFTSPIYAVCEGLLLGWLSARMNVQYPGIVLQAVMLTFAVFFFVLALYRFQIIRPTETFMKVIYAATGGIALLYFVSMFLSIFGIHIPMIHSSGPVGILFSLVVTVVAALNLVVDFAFIEQGAAGGLPKHMEWFSAFALLVTIVWLYIELLELLAKLNGRRDR